MTKKPYIDPELVIIDLGLKENICNDNDVSTGGWWDQEETADF